MAPSASRALTGVATGVVLVGVIVGSVTGEPMTALVSLGAVVAVAAGWVVVSHDPRSPVGPALAWSSACIALIQVIDVLAASAFTLDPLPLSGLARHVWVGSWPVNLAGVFALLLVFPHGRRPGRLWSALPWLYAAGTAGMVFAQWGAREEGGRVVGEIGPLREAVAVMSIVVIGIALVLAVASVVAVYRQGGSQSREQIRWLNAAGVIVVGLLVAGWVGEALGLTLALAYSPFLLAILILVPVAVGVAVMRYDLFDVDRLLSQSASWALTLAFSAAVYGVVVLGASQVVGDIVALGSTAAAFVTALVLLPLHRFVAGFVGRVVDRDRYVAVATMERFAADVHAGRREPEDVEEALRTAQGDPGLRVLLAGPNGTWVGMDGSPTVAAEGFTVEAHGDGIARILLGRTSARSRRRIADLAPVAWVPIEVSRLRLVLRDALEETLASRARLAEATAAERRRLERDLHDGAQQRLLAIGMRLRLLQRELTGRHAVEVDAAVIELQDTVDELRHLANGIRPSRLDDGLAAALAAVREATPLPVDLVVDELPSVDEIRTLTAYLVVSEAVANALKHAGASRIDVRVTARDGRIAVAVRDDGIGGVPGDEPLRALRDRVLSVGGTLGIDSPPGLGTTINAVL